MPPVESGDSDVKPPHPMILPLQVRQLMSKQYGLLGCVELKPEA
jgi:hypothetical protein